MSAVKISVVGAGSGAFSLSVVRNLCLTPSLHGSTVSFMDVDEGRLAAVARLCERYAKELGVALTVEATTDRRESLRGADFVVNTALTAGHERLREGWRIALRHGFRFPGSYHVLYDEAFWVNFYQLRFFDSLTEDMLEVCPGAWHLMVANPVLAGTTHLTRKYPKARMVGICHGYAEAYRLAEGLGYSREGLSYEIAGVNHFVWLTRLEHRGKDLLPELRRAAESQQGDPRKRMFGLLGVHPIGDTCGWSGALWPWWNNLDQRTEDGWKDDPDEQGTMWDGYLNAVREGPEEIRRAARDESVKVSVRFPPRKDDELLVPLIESIACDVPRVFMLNFQNSGGFVAGIPRDFEVEAPARASGRGVEGMKARELPKQVVAYILRERVAPVEVELEAYRTGSREVLLQLILMDKWCTSKEQASAFLDEILALPYHGEMREHFR
jgi:alpha-galactosidase